MFETVAKPTKIVFENLTTFCFGSDFNHICFYQCYYNHNHRHHHLLTFVLRCIRVFATKGDERYISFSANPFVVSVHVGIHLLNQRVELCQTGRDVLLDQAKELI